jgi:hypothetical protein
VQYWRTSLLRGRPSTEIEVSNSSEIFTDFKSRQVKLFKLTSKFMKGEVIFFLKCVVLEVPEKDKDLNVGL